MDKLSRYQQLIKCLLSARADLWNGLRRTETETLCAFDDEHGQYILINTGWVGDKRTQGVTTHVRLKNGKFWVEEDWTSDSIAEELVANGVPREDIVLGFQAPEMRPYTDFAAA